MSFCGGHCWLLPFTDLCICLAKGCLDLQLPTEIDDDLWIDITFRKSLSQSMFNSQSNAVFNWVHALQSPPVLTDADPLGFDAAI